MYRILLLANTIFESTIGMAQILFPKQIWRTDNEVAIAVARMYGIAVLSLAATSLMMLILNRTKEHMLGGFVTLSIFHIGLTIAQIVNVVNGFGNFTDPFIHAIFAFMFVASLIKEIRDY